MSARRVEALKTRHAELEEALVDELRRPLPNLALVRGIKRRKLALKDEIALLHQSQQRA